MTSRGRADDDARAIVYCIVPRDLAAKLYEPLRKHFRSTSGLGIDVVVEQRGRERRTRSDRRSGGMPAGEIVDRRTIRSRHGRRVADRRAQVVTLELRDLPRRLQRYADRLTFVERLMPSSLHAEDVDTAHLVSRFQAGDRDAFGEIYIRYFDRVYGYFQVVLKDRHEAEEATQHVFAAVFEALPRYERLAQPFRAWLFVIVRNRAVDAVRRLGRTELLPPDEVETHRDDPEEAELPALDWLTDRELMLFVERLPLAQRQVLVLRFLLGLTSKEIAAVLNRRPDDVRALQSRGLRFLRARLTAIGHRSGAVRDPRPRMRRRYKQAVVLRSRRYALM